MINVGICGLGFMGMIHYLAYQKVRGAKVKAICEKIPERLAGDWRSIKGNFGPQGEIVNLDAMARYMVGTTNNGHSIADMLDIPKRGFWDGAIKTGWPWFIAFRERGTWFPGVSSLFWAFDELLRPYRDRLWAVCLRTTGHRADAEDALQDALIAIWQNLPKFRGEASISTWAFRIASNAALAVLRRRREVTVDDEHAEHVFDRPDGSDHAEDNAVRDRVQRALSTLSEDFRTVLVLREFADYTYEQIADYQQVPVQTVRSRLNRARKQLKEALLAQEGVE